MTYRANTAVQTERQPRDVGTSREAYFRDLDPDNANVSGLGYGQKSVEATAFLKELGGGLLGLDNDEDYEDRALHRVDSEQILIGDDDLELLFLYTPRALAVDMGTFTRASTASYTADTSVTELHYTPGAGHLAEYFTRSTTATYNTSS